MLPAERKAHDAKWSNPDALFDDVPDPVRRGPRDWWTPERERAFLETVTAAMADETRPAHHRTGAGAIRRLLVDPGWKARFVAQPYGQPDQVEKSLRNKLSQIRSALGLD